MKQLHSHYALFALVFNMFICMLISSCYGKVLSISMKAKSKDVGRSTRTKFYSSAIVRTLGIIVTLLMVLLPLNITSACASMEKTDASYFTLAILLFFPHQGLTTPFLYTFSTTGFRTKIKSLCLS